MNLNGYLFSNSAQCLAEPVPGNTAADRIEFGNKGMKVPPSPRRGWVAFWSGDCGSSGHRILSEVRIILVPLQNCPGIFGPVYAKNWIIPPHASRVFRGMHLRHLVENFCVILKGLKSVSASCRNVHHFAVFFVEADRNMSLEGT